MKIREMIGYARVPHVGARSVVQQNIADMMTIYIYLIIHVFLYAKI